MIKFNDNFKVAKKVLAAVSKKISKKVAKNCSVESYANGREQGFSIAYYPQPIYNKWSPKRVCFSENRNSDDIVCYFGGTHDFDISSNIPGEKCYQERKFFRYDKVNDAAQFIVDFFTKGKQ